MKYQQLNAVDCHIRGLKVTASLLFGFCHFADTQLLSVCLSTQQSADYGAPEKLIGSNHATRTNGQRAM